MVVRGGPGSSRILWNDFPWSTQTLLWSNRKLVIGRPNSNDAVRILGLTPPSGSTQKAVGASCLLPGSVGSPGFAIWIGLCGPSLFSWVGIPLSWALSSPAWPFPSPTQLATKLGHLLHVWRLAQACWVGHVLNYDPRLHANYSYGRLQFPRSSRLTPSGALLILDDTHLHDTLLYLPGRRFGLSSLVSRIPSSLFLSMDSELLLSMENLQFTEEESGSVVMEPPGDEGESSLWLKPASGSRRKQGIEYFDINDVPSGVPAAPAVEDPISRAGSGTAPTDATIMKPTGVAEGPVPVASPLDSSTQPVSSVTAAKATAPAPTVPTSSANIETATCDELERVLDIESPVPKHVDSGNMIGVCQAAGTLEKVEGSCSVAGIVASDSEGRAAVCHAAVISELAGSKHAAVLQDSEEGTGMGPALPLVPSTAIGATPARAKRSLQGKYEVCTPFQPKRTRLKDHASFAWKGLHAVLQELRSGFSWATSGASQPSRLLWGDHHSGLARVWYFLPGSGPPPPSGTVAISVDGAFTPDHGAGVGVVARDSTGAVLGAG
ncbi:hypothetical protein V6N11_035761 [Hibiscus sabdariffa]|uniref:RNase H type-1 domain-containing protein n=1 Tax=Hibiscus sabdariffa TaxID=183260 RepID=A0ABR2R8W5_9ROSI